MMILARCGSKARTFVGRASIAHFTLNDFGSDHERKRPTRYRRCPTSATAIPLTLGGIIGSLARKYTKRGEPYAQFRLEGLAGGVEVIAFPGVYEAVPKLVQPDTIVLVTGRSTCAAGSCNPREPR